MDTYKSPLHKMTKTSPTVFWNDSCALDELEYAIENGAVGATTNPVIIRNVLKKEMDIWKSRINEIIKEMPEADEEQIAWKLNEEMALRGAELLMPVFERENCKRGTISIQVNPRFYRDWRRMAEQAEYFSSLAPNIQVKIPATSAGIKAVEEATARGVNVTATVCFTAAQAVAVAEAVERGLEKRASSGMDTEKMIPICAIMIGRLDDWLKVVANKEDIIVDPEVLEWPGVAVFKKAYRIFSEKKYRCGLLTAAYRNHYHWSEFIGGDVSLTIPYKWQKRFNNSDIEVIERMNNPVSEKILDSLESKFSDFRKAYYPEELNISGFDSFGSTARTMRSFLEGYDSLLQIIREYMIPNPDLS